MKKLLYLCLVITLSCSDYSDKSILEKLSDEELVESLKDGDSTTIQFHNYFNSHRRDIYSDDINRIEFSAITYGDVSTYLNKKYHDSLHFQLLSPQFDSYKEKYYHAKHTEALKYIDSVFILNNRAFKGQYDFNFKGIDGQGYILFDLNNKSKEEGGLVNISIYTVVDSALVTIGTGYKIVDRNESSRIKSVLSISSLLGSLKNKPFKEDTLYHNLKNNKNTVIYFDSGEQGRFKDVIGHKYAARIKFGSKLTGLGGLTFSNWDYKMFFENELQKDYLIEQKLRGVFYDSVLDNISNFKKVRRLLDHIKFDKEYER